MFERPHHRRIATVLQALDADALLANACLFGGGTAMALRFGEYRESVDIGFLVSRVDGYRQLRQRLMGPDGLRAITRPGEVLNPSREMRADQYGVRTLLQVEGADIKLEIVLEARIELEAPGPDDRLCGVATLTPLDMATSKLLANADRWSDDGVFSRDVIDLAMMRLFGGFDESSCDGPSTKPGPPTATAWWSIWPRPSRTCASGPTGWTIA